MSFLDMEGLYYAGKPRAKQFLHGLLFLPGEKEMKMWFLTFLWVVFLPVIYFLAYPFRILNDIFDPSKTTSARSRKCRLFPKCTEDDRACRKEFSPGALLSVTFLGQARKVTTGMKKGR
jgi:hypothetical protein